MSSACSSGLADAGSLEALATVTTAKIRAVQAITNNGMIAQPKSLNFPAAFAMVTAAPHVAAKIARDTATFGARVIFIAPQKWLLAPHLPPRRIRTSRQFLQSPIFSRL